MNAMDERRRDFDSPAFEAAFHCTEPLGAQCSEMETRFALWAPTASEVVLNLYTDGTGAQPYVRKPMRRGDRGRWVYEAGRNMSGAYYDYDVTVDGVTRRTADPYARACGLNGARSMALDLQRTDPPGWERDRAPALPAENIIYELHVKEFTWDPSTSLAPELRGKYRALAQRGTRVGAFPTGLDYLRWLGVTHVQLMPVFDFGSVDEAGDPDAFNWGYDPVNMNVPEGSYSSDPAHGEVRIRELKEAIQALHESGIRVIMDVVYNHTYRLDSCLNRAVPGYYYRYTEKGKPSNGSGCGSELATERSMCARYILDSVLYWAEEYHIDGFRFDLMGLLDTELMNRVQWALDRRWGPGEKLVYGEPWAGGSSSPRPGTVLADKAHLKELDASIAAFCDMTRDAIRGSLGRIDTRGFASGGPFNAQWLARCVQGWAGPDGDVQAASQTVNYISCHDDWTLWDKLTSAVCGGHGFLRARPQALRANRLAAAMLMCCQGHVFMLSGEEFARTKQGVRNTYRSPIQLNAIDWKRARARRELAQYYRGLIALRKRLPALTDKRREAAGRVMDALSPRGDSALLRLDNTAAAGTAEESPWSELLLCFNTGLEPLAVDLPEGAWTPLLNAESSFLWQKPRSVRGRVQLPPVSALFLGKA